AVLLNTVFPAEMLPLRSVVAAQTTLVVGLALAVVGSLALGRASWCILLVPVPLLLQVMFLVGASWMLSPVYLLVRDLSQIVNLLMLVLFVISPIAYRPESLGGTVQLLLWLNPLYYYITMFQNLLFDGTLPAPAIVLVALALSIATFACGF